MTVHNGAVALKLRPYQQRDLGRIRLAFGQGHRRVLYRLPTGGGKTVTFGSALALTTGQALVVAHRRELVAQAVATLDRLGVRAGVIAGGHREPTEGQRLRVLVGTVPALRSRGLPAWFAPQFVVADEAHLAVSDSWRHVLLELCVGARVLGVTATPERLDGQPLGDLFAAMVEGPSIAELTDLGHLVPAVTYSTPALPVVQRVAQLDRGAAMNTPQLVGDVVSTYQRLGKGRTALVFASSIKHGAVLRARFERAGYVAALLTGETPLPQRERQLQRLSDGQLQVLINVGVLVEGFDEPRVSYIGLARATSSLTLYMQAVGRGLRLHPGKTDCIVADHGGNAELRFGPVAMPRVWSLDGERRGRAVATADAALAVATCEQCLAVYQRAEHDACPRCGAAPLPVERRFPRQVVGELERLERAAWEERERERSRQTPPRPAPAWCPAPLWQSLEETRQAEGYLPGWTVGRARFLTRKRRR